MQEIYKYLSDRNPLLFIILGSYLMIGCNEKEPEIEITCFPLINSGYESSGILLLDGDLVDSMYNFHGNIYDVCGEIEVDFEQNELGVYTFDIVTSTSCEDPCVYLANISNPYCVIPYEETQSRHYMTSTTWDLGYGYLEGKYFHPPCRYQETFELDNIGVNAFYDSEDDIYFFGGIYGLGDCNQQGYGMEADTVNQTIQAVYGAGNACLSPDYYDQYKRIIGNIITQESPFFYPGPIFNYEIINNRMVWFNEDSTRHLVFYTREPGK